jgi:hypothetical protein
MDQKESYKAKSKFTGLMIDPDDLTIVGLDCKVSPGLEDFADPPERLAAPIDPEMVLNVSECGIITPVKIKRIHGRSETFVVEGRRRVRAAREANKALRKAGDHNFVQVPCVPESRADVVTVAIVGNTFGLQETPIMRARNAERLRSRGFTDDQIMAKMGVQKPTLATWALLLQASPEAQEAVANGKAVATEVVKEVRKAKREGRPANAPKQRAPKERVQLPIRAIRALHQELTPAEGDEPDQVADLALAILSFLLGEDPTAKGLAEFSGSEIAVKACRKIRRELSAP